MDTLMYGNTILVDTLRYVYDDSNAFIVPFESYTSREQFLFLMSTS